MDVPAARPGLAGEPEAVIWVWSLLRKLLSEGGGQEETMAKRLEPEIFARNVFVLFVGGMFVMIFTIGILLSTLH